MAWEENIGKERECEFPSHSPVLSERPITGVAPLFSEVHSSGTPKIILYQIRHAELKLNALIMIPHQATFRPKSDERRSLPRGLS